jgi:hypothetical protein
MNYSRVKIYTGITKTEREWEDGRIPGDGGKRKRTKTKRKRNGKDG